MPTDCITYKDTNYFSSLICDYLDEKETLKPYYNRFPSLENFKAQIDEKKSQFSEISRTVLVESLKAQYINVETSNETEANIKSLLHKDTFTITTGHQLNLFTGPLYFFYKIISTINLCKELKAAYPQQGFVPVYWMATEDHDFEEINFFNFKGKKIRWNKNASGAVGELDLEGLQQILDQFGSHLNTGKNAETLKNLFQDAYIKCSNLTEATRFLVNELFSETGLVIIDGNDKELKRLFLPFAKEELLNQTSFRKVTETSQQLNNLTANYKIQVNPREINLFYLKENLRERIVFEDELYKVLNTNITWNKSELIKHLNEVPERFSPNVILRPLYQEVILPNLCYIGGGGELAYWFQLKSNFEAQDVTFPILLLRNSALLVSKKQQDKLEKLDVSSADLFLKQDQLLEKVTRERSAVKIDFSKQQSFLKKQFEDLYDLAEKTDKSFLGAVSAQEKKQIKGLENLEKRLLKAQKRKLKEILDRVTSLQNELFPNMSLQERQANFSEFYLEYGDQFIQQLMLNLQPLNQEFLILNLE
ncbi:bacillithiol biosynthesis cysteine-adding enzyme BshC [Xanthomarina sp. F2636L]|uniref:bacillithiol biosynthesis cysteine-adding enzyme BshC n=1 Tax=Xanthomarina sp. F2636L TaxID=2996018 RepID=UPI00225E6ADC|nr:bacillithiol biosynthesis cysteine-adding enzyme BshC [Xanthomarina sp. F2636L]MCX7549313.1 bacillithiol biosynthesis cysteine-adding enzyme BshC [Xanthomarina sp. F2636L]